MSCFSVQLFINHCSLEGITTAITLLHVLGKHFINMEDSNKHNLAPSQPAGKQEMEGVGAKDLLSLPNKSEGFVRC